MTSHTAEILTQAFMSFVFIRMRLGLHLDTTPGSGMVLKWLFYVLHGSCPVISFNSLAMPLSHCTYPASEVLGALGLGQRSQQSLHSFSSASQGVSDKHGKARDCWGKQHQEWKLVNE